MSNSSNPCEDQGDVNDTARASAETALAEAKEALKAIEARVYGSAVNLGSDIVNLARAALEHRT